MKEIFISYSTIDIASAETVRNVLEQNGLSCWMAPRDIPGGSNYTKEIPNAIRNCKAFVLILSANAQSSHWVLKELDSAVNAGKVILPFMVEDCALNDEFNFLLTGAQRYAAYQKRAEVLSALVDRIKAVIAPKPVVKPETVPTEPVRVEAPAAPRVSEVPKEPAVSPAAPEAPKAEKKPAVSRTAAPVVQKAKPQKPKKERQKIPFVFGKTEKLAALGIPGMSLISVLGYLMGNNLYMATTYPLQYGLGDIVLYTRDYQMMATYVLVGMLIGAVLWWEWVRFRHRELMKNPEPPVCPACASNQLRVSSFRTRRMTGVEWATFVLVPVCMLANLYIHPVGMMLLSTLFKLSFITMLDKVGICILMSGLVQGLAIGLWLSNMLVRRLRRRKGLRSTACRCCDCRAAFLPVAERK